MPPASCSPAPSGSQRHEHEVAAFGERGYRGALLEGGDLLGARRPLVRGRRGLDLVWRRLGELLVAEAGDLLCVHRIGDRLGNRRRRRRARGRSVARRGRLGDRAGVGRVLVALEPASGGAKDESREREPLGVRARRTERLKGRGQIEGDHQVVVAYALRGAPAGLCPRVDEVQGRRRGDARTEPDGFRIAREAAATISAVVGKSTTFRAPARTQRWSSARCRRNRRGSVQRAEYRGSRTLPRQTAVIVKLSLALRTALASIGANRGRNPPSG